MTQQSAGQTLSSTGATVAVLTPTTRLSVKFTDATSDRRQCQRHCDGVQDCWARNLFFSLSRCLFWTSWLFIPVQQQAAILPIRIRILRLLLVLLLQAYQHRPYQYNWTKRRIPLQVGRRHSASSGTHCKKCFFRKQLNKQTIARADFLWPTDHKSARVHAGFYFRPSYLQSIKVTRPIKFTSFLPVQLVKGFILPFL